MDVDCVAKLAERGIERNVGCHLLHDVGSVCTEDMCAEQTSFVGFAAELHHALRLVHRQSLAVGTIEGLVAFEWNALLLQLVFRWTNASNLWVCEDSGGHDVEANAVNSCSLLLAPKIRFTTCMPCISAACASICFPFTSPMA